MSRTLGDDFDEDDLPGGSLDLERGSHTGGGGMGSAASSYDAGGMDFDDDPFAEDGPAGALELDLPTGSATAMRSAAPGAHSAPPSGRSAPPGGPAIPDLGFGPPPAPRPSATMAAVSPPSASPSRVVTSEHHAPPSNSLKHAASLAPDPSAPASAPAASALPARPTAAAIIAKYPDAPVEVWRAPKYTVQVLLRQFELRSELESLRRRRSPDVPLYESALRAYDTRTFRLGMALNAAIFVVATFIVFLPVILRFVRAAD